MKFTGLSTVVFDLDGTLCRYKMGTAEAIAATLERTGLSPDVLGPTEDAAIRYLELWHEEEQRESDIPFRTRIWTRLLHEHGIDDPGLAAALGNTYVEIRLPSLELEPVALQLLSSLRTRYRLGLLTNGPSEMQWPKIERFGLTRYFDAVLVAGDVGIYKPDPRVFSLLLSQLGAAATGAVYVGNSYEMDVVGAKAAGMHSIWVRTDGEAAGDSIRPDLEIDRLERLEEVL